ncbi:MAG: glycosyltransferase family 9 protein [Nanoarchaeota archaeon]
MERLRFKLLRKLRTVFWYLDYIIWKIFSFRKFKPQLKPKSILIIELKYIGDLIVSTPTISALKEHFPKAKIDIAVPVGMKDVLYNNPHLNKIIEWNPKNLPNSIPNYDLAIILHPGSFKISTLTKHIPFRIGSCRAGILEGKGFFLHRKTKPTKKWKLKILDNLDVIKTIGITTKDIFPKIYTDPKVEKTILNDLPKRYVVFHAAANYPSHNWSIRNWADLADKLDLPVIFTGSKEQHNYNQEIIALTTKKQSKNFAGSSLKEFFAIIKNAAYVISVDTSAMHVAAAFNKKVISLFGAGEPNVWKPLTKESTVIFHNEVCTTCHQYTCSLKGKRFMECMKSITVDEVLSKI